MISTYTSIDRIRVISAFSKAKTIPASFTTMNDEE